MHVIITNSTINIINSTDDSKSSNTVNSCNDINHVQKYLDQYNEKGGESRNKNFAGNLDEQKQIHNE